LPAHPKASARRSHARWRCPAWNLVLVARRAGPLAALAETLRAACGVDVRTVTCDLSELRAADLVLDACRGLEVGILVYNAAAAPVGRFLEIPIDAHLRAVEVNARGPHAPRSCLGRSDGATRPRRDSC
jgi:short-subunit dehydrogenase